MMLIVFYVAPPFQKYV